MPCACIDAACSLLPRIASSPPCTFGCRVLTRPSIISGKPVSAATSMTSRPASFSALAVPPVDTSSTPKPASAVAKSMRPVLSDTDSKARTMRRGWLIMMYGLAQEVGESVFGRAPSSRASTRNDGLELQRQFRLVRPADAGAGGHRRAIAEAPAHFGVFAGMAVDHDLHGPARSVIAGQEHAFLDLDGLAEGGEGPDLAVRQQQDDAAAIRQPAGLDRRMQVEADGEFIGRARREAAGVGRRKAILAVERAAVGAELDRAAMDHAEFGGIAVMRRAQGRAARLVFALDAYVARAT